MRSKNATFSLYTDMLDAGNVRLEQVGSSAHDGKTILVEVSRVEVSLLEEDILSGLVFQQELNKGATEAPHPCEFLWGKAHLRFESALQLAHAHRGLPGGLFDADIAAGFQNAPNGILYALIRLRLPLLHKRCNNRR